jgi:uncharacterized coiled-coil DUF342 family protein
MIFEAIAAIKVANDAISAIKQMAGHVSSIGEMGKHLTKLTDAEDQIREKAKSGDMDAFFALEKIEQQKKAVREMMIYSGRAGLWEDWQRFQATRRQMRENEKKAAEAKKKKRKQDIKNAVIVCGGVIASLTLIGVFIMIIMWFAKGGSS